MNVLAALRKGPLREPAHAWLYEVKNRTGYGGKETYADALVVSVFPSRGIWFAGIEAKISRQDWLREVDDPDKSNEIQKFCDYWWVAAPEGIIEIGEVPEKWGLYVIDGKKVKVAREAPRLEPIPLTRVFVASVLRNEAKKMDRAKQEGHAEGIESAKQLYGGEKVSELQEQLYKEQNERRKSEQSLSWKERELAELKHTISTFERSSGISGLSSFRGDARNIGEQFKAAELLAQIDRQNLAERFRDVADALEALPTTDEKISATG